MQRLILTAAALIGFAASEASAQLRQQEVLVIYDSRIPSSLSVAEYYAGSAKVPGGDGGVRGARPGVRVVNLATLGAPVTTGGNISWADFHTRLRIPIRDYLTQQGLTKEVRCLVTTKGLPHRVFDTDNTTVGDNPVAFVDEFIANDATCSSVDAELVMLAHDLTVGEAGGASDSKADGAIQNPYWRQTVPIRNFHQANNFAAKTYTANGLGPVWLPSGTAGTPPRLGSGDLFLVTRLDGATVADVRGMIDRAQHILYDVSGHRALLDESDSNGIADGAGNNEFDNSVSAMPTLRDQDDYEATRGALQADGRFASAFIRYNALGGGTEFFIGPRVQWQPPGAIMINEPVVLVASYGANHTGRPRDINGTLADTFYATSYNYPNGAIFNTIESYNGRDFNNLGQLGFAMQQQASSFLNAGGTLAIANVWEPLADSVPDNRLIALNFISGTRSWAEAAWSATPALSWMQMTLGDPLARAFRTSEDRNASGRVDVDDLYTWEATPGDLNGSGQADAADRLFILSATRSWERADLLTGR